MENQSELIDPKLYKQANKRVHFKLHFAIWALAMLVLWLVYYFVFKTSEAAGPIFFKSILFVTLLWTVILVFHYLFVYKLNNNMLDREIKSLQKEIAEKETLKKALEEQKRKNELEKK
ncbi:MAG: hypothetical protein J5642_06190 [Bacteroidales bacterium]|nr:hypothetical protein [Bacteroidales bacterium]